MLPIQNQFSEWGEMREVVNFPTCTVPATAITLNPMNPSAFKITTGDASNNRFYFHSDRKHRNM